MLKVVLGLVSGILFLALGAYFGKQYFGTEVSFITQVERFRDDVVVSHERDITMYYHVCPERDEKFSLLGTINRPPKLFIIFPATLKYKLSLKDLEITERENEYVVKLGIIQADKPFINTGKVTSIVTESKAGTAEERYENREKARATDIVSYLTLSQLETDTSNIKERMEKEVSNLLKAILSTREGDHKSIKIAWDNSAQINHINNQKKNIGAKPPFGVKGCSSSKPDFIVNGLMQSL